MKFLPCILVVLSGLVWLYVRDAGDFNATEFVTDDTFASFPCFVAAVAWLPFYRRRVDGCPPLIFCI
ncbi:hypothetical protein [Leptolyngbya ohadii]|uniref:hypothetical protein n=1 Tax=Leptolyngbya ohadii TaxID=1962290 RepID=UPI00117B990B|nr:hypothetical protein [Leptolyngbya ohadii]